MIYKDPPPDFKKEIDVVGCYVQHEDGFLLLHRHAEKSNGNRWGLPAGKAERGETINDAMVRELREETGIETAPDDLKYFGHVAVRHNNHDFEYHMFSIDCKDAPDVRLSPHEHQDFYWAMPTEALAMDLVEDQAECIKLFFDTA